MTEDDFRKDEKTIDAVVRNFEIIGEAASKLPEEIINEHREIEWNRIIGLRNRIIHEYFGVDAGILWSIVSNEIIPLKHSVQSVLRDQST